MRKRFVLKSSASENKEVQVEDLLSWFEEFKKYGIQLKIKNNYDLCENIGAGTFSKVHSAI